jgi:hypothetical protein
VSHRGCLQLGHCVGLPGFRGIHSWPHRRHFSFRFIVIIICDFRL